MKNLSSAAKVYILSTTLAGFGLIAWMLLSLNWANPGLYILAVLGAVAQTLKVEGPNARTNYSIAWFIYGFAFIAFGPVAAMFVVVVSHLVEWAWHKYPWYIQCFNIGNHVVSLYLAGLVFEMIAHGTQVTDLLSAIGLVVANLIFVLGNHLLVGVVIKLARGQSFAESGVFGFLTLFLDFCILSMGATTALVWRFNPFVSILNVMPLYLLYNALRVPALKRQLAEANRVNIQVGASATGD
jgi:hypothetical protein